MTVKLRESNNVEVAFEKIYRKEKTEKGGGGGRGGDKLRRVHLKRTLERR